MNTLDKTSPDSVEDTERIEPARELEGDPPLLKSKEGYKRSHIGQEIDFSSMTPDRAASAVSPDLFVGGLDNGPLLRELIETAAEQPDSAVLWIHGPQPLTQPPAGSTALDLVHEVRLYDYQLTEGPNTLMQSLQGEDVSNLLSCQNVRHQSTVEDLRHLASAWEREGKILRVQRAISAQRPAAAIMPDREAWKQVTCLWAAEEVTRLLADGHGNQAMKLATNCSLITPITGAVVLDNPQDYKRHGLQARVDNQLNDTYSTRSGGLIGAPVDPRYGQSNEIGQLADFGYDTARDLSRLVTAISALIALIIAACFVRGQKSVTRMVLGKAVALVLAVPIVVHLVGTFMINNFGGLGGGL